jgi:nicotinate-nucleotide adenylyltransferase
MRLGLLGGTFDPIHRGHLDAAAAARAVLSLDQVLVVPALDPPHRHAEPHASSYHRFAMAALAVGALDGFAVSDLEMCAAGPSYTARTLARLHALGWRPWQLFFIAGSDAFADIATWRDYPTLLDLGHFVVVSRPGHGVERLRQRVPDLAPRIVPVEAGGRLGRDAAFAPPATHVFFIEALTADVSSTGIRERLASGSGIDDLVPEAVERHIRKHRLYIPAGRPADLLHEQD